jgi:hypothetical protein
MAVSATLSYGKAHGLEDLWETTLANLYVSANVTADKGATKLEKKISSFTRICMKKGTSAPTTTDIPRRVGDICLYYHTGTKALVPYVCTALNVAGTSATWTAIAVTG